MDSWSAVVVHVAGALNGPGDIEGFGGDDNWRLLQLFLPRDIGLEVVLVGPQVGPHPPRPG